MDTRLNAHDWLTAHGWPVTHANLSVIEQVRNLSDETLSDPDVRQAFIRGADAETILRSILNTGTAVPATVPAPEDDPTQPVPVTDEPVGEDGLTQAEEDQLTALLAKSGQRLAETDSREPFGGAPYGNAGGDTTYNYVQDQPFNPWAPPTDKRSHPSDNTASKVEALEQKVDLMALDLSAVQTAVTSEVTVDQSAIALITSIAAEVTTLQGQVADPATIAALGTLADQLNGSSTALAAAITANTPAAPPVTPGAPPAD